MHFKLSHDLPDWRHSLRRLFRLALHQLQIKEAYSVLKQLIPLITENQGSNNLKGLLVDQNKKVDSVTIGGYTIKGRLGRRFGGDELAGVDIFGAAPGATGSQPAPEQVGGATIICMVPGEFIISGRNMSIDFSPAIPNDSSNASFLSLEEGSFVDNKWVPLQHLNGDEFHIALSKDKSRIFKASMNQY